MARFIRNNRFYILGFLVLAVVLVANAFPRGYVFSGGDTAQFIEAKNNLRNLFYNWEGRAFFYYAIFYVLDYLKVSDSAQLSWYLGIFIVGSYISFGIFSKLLFDASDKAKALVSLFYALNLYSLSFFSGNLGFSYYPSLYIFIPVLTGLFIKFLVGGKNIYPHTHNAQRVSAEMSGPKNAKSDLFRCSSCKFVGVGVYGVFFVLALALAASGFGNSAFVFSFAIFLTLIIFSLALLKIIRISKSLLARLIVLGLFSFLISAYWILPLVPQVRSGVEGLANSDVLEFHWVIRSTASPILSTVALLYPGNDRWPDNFPYASLHNFKNVFLALAYFPAILVFLGLFYLKKFKTYHQKFFFGFRCNFFDYINACCSGDSSF